MRFYKIKKGDHYCSMSIFEKIGALGWKVKTMEVKFLFRSECWWAPPRNNDDLDQNKLAGIGFGVILISPKSSKSTVIPMMKRKAIPNSLMRISHQSMSCNPARERSNQSGISTG
jgi:hypothetical protein